VRDADKIVFAKILSRTLELYGQSATKDATAVWWASLQRFTIEEVGAAFAAHIQDPQRGRFKPLPADLISAITESDGRPGADEAWSHCPMDETQTVVWTTETKAAFFEAAYGIVDDDRIAARMAFKDAYNRLVAQARRDRDPLTWEVTLGHDIHGRRTAIERAVELGRLTHSYAARLLPPPETDAMHVFKQLASTKTITGSQHGEER
jgi:hypothetical protein